MCAWGDNEGIDYPVWKPGLSGSADLATGPYQGLALESDGTVWAWGDNDDGQLGVGINQDWTDEPVQVKGSNGQGFLTNVVELAAGENHTMGLTGDGKVWGWGYDEWGQMGDRVKAIRTPTPVQSVFAANNAPQMFGVTPRITRG